MIIPYGNHDVHGTMNWLWSQPTLIPWIIQGKVKTSLQGGSIPSTSCSHSSTPVHSHSRTHSLSTSEDIQPGSIEPLTAEKVTTADAEDSVGQTSFSAYEMSLLHIL